jgi:hypothetical protein
MPPVRTAAASDRWAKRKNLMDMGYPVTCACGCTHRVSAGAAGTLIACGCGRQVQVPSLRTLRAAAGEPVASPEMEIRARLQDGQLPEERECVCCGVATDDVSHARVVCERSEVSDTRLGDMESFAIKLISLLLVPIGFFFSRRGEARERGRDISFRLPLRVCDLCARRLRGRRLVEAMRRVPAYTRLFEKYPHAEVMLERG